MKHSRALCALIMTAMACSFVPPGNALTDVSSWAEPDVMAASAAGLMPDTFAALAAKSSVSRAPSTCMRPSAKRRSNEPPKSISMTAMTPMSTPHTR